MDALTATRKPLASLVSAARVVGRRSGGVSLGLLVCAATLVGCSSDATDPVSVPAQQLYWALHVNWPAINLALTAPYNTMQLSATPVSASGAALATDSAVHYKTLDSTVTVSSTGLLTARYLTDRTTVVASLAVNGVTLTDTAWVRVTADPLASPMATFSMQPTPDGLDSAKISLDAYYNVNQYNGNIPVIVTLQDQETICHVYDIGCQILIDFQSSDPSVATLDSRWGYLEALRPGHVTFYASTYAYGVGKRDSLPFVIGYSNRWFAAAQLTAGSDNPLLYYAQSSYNLGVGGWIGVSNGTSDTLVVTFPYHTPKIYNIYGDPAKASQMTDTFPPDPNNTVYVEFDSAGTYHFSTSLLRNPAKTTSITINVLTGP